MYQTNEEKRAILLGLAIGDGNIYYNKKGAGIIIRHSDKQLEYLQYKILLLKSIYNTPINIIKVQNGNQIAKGDTKHFRIYRKWLYPNGVKTISKVLKYLNLQSVAIWYMDDGSLTAKKRNGKVHGYELTLNTYVDKEENQKIIDWFLSKYNIRFTQTKGKGKYRLRMGTKEAKRFCSLIKLYIIPSMKYKLI